MPKVVNLHTRHDTRESPPLHQSHPRVHRAVLPFFLRYEINGKRVWEGLGTRTYTFVLADARSKESSLLREEATQPKPNHHPPRRNR